MPPVRPALCPVQTGPRLGRRGGNCLEPPGSPWHAMRRSESGPGGRQICAVLPPTSDLRFGWSWRSSATFASLHGGGLGRPPPSCALAWTARQRIRPYCRRQGAWHALNAVLRLVGHGERGHPDTRRSQHRGGWLARRRIRLTPRQFAERHDLKSARQGGCVLVPLDAGTCGLGVSRRAGRHMRRRWLCAHLAAG